MTYKISSFDKIIILIAFIVIFNALFGSKEVSTDPKNKRVVNSENTKKMNQVKDLNKEDKISDETRVKVCNDLNGIIREGIEAGNRGEKVSLSAIARKYPLGTFALRLAYDACQTTSLEQWQCVLGTALTKLGCNTEGDI